MSDLLRARQGDARSFEALVAPYRGELAAHAYRMTGSLADAEDAVQEALVRAWRGLAGFEERSSLRGWLYRVCTNVCLDALSSKRARELPSALGAPHEGLGPPAAPELETPWLEPCPAPLWTATPSGADARLSGRQSVAVAFLAAIQHLPPLQRAVLLLRDVVGFSAEESASVLESSVPAINSALQRARATLESRRDVLLDDTFSPADAAACALLQRYVQAWESGETQALTALLREDALLTMPPVPTWFRGREAIVRFLAWLLPQMGALRLQLIEANGGLGAAAWLRAPGDDTFRAQALHVLSGGPDGLARLDVFLNPQMFKAFGLPDTLDR